MAFRILLIENNTTITLKLNNIILSRDDVEEIWVPINDVSTIVIDNLKTKISGRLMCTLAQYNVAVIFCDQSHLPIGLYTSYDNHSRVSKMIDYQINRPNEYYDSLWKDIVEVKILNQATVLRLLNKDEEVIDSIECLGMDVLAGDKTNREGHAAKLYLNELMGTSFSRGNEDILLNSGLDYGYTIIRSYIARVCAGYGLNGQIGIHHKNEYNRFNLIDDLIEPIRPFVDYFAFNLLKNEEYFKPEHRHELINILNHKLKYKNKVM